MEAGVSQHPSQQQHLFCCEGNERFTIIAFTTKQVQAVQLTQAHALEISCRLVVMTYTSLK